MNNYKALWFVMFFFVIKTGYAQLATGSWDSNYSALYFNTDNSTPNCMIVAYKPNSILSFRTLNMDRMWLTSTGNFGIGVSTPSSLLHVQSALAGTSGNDYKIANFTTSTGDYFRFGTGYWNPNNLEINAFALSGLKSLVLQGDLNAGNVGIGSFGLGSGGAITPTSKLHVQYGNIQITNSQTAPDITKTGLTLGSLGTSIAAATDYSWIQSSHGPLLLNPSSGNTLTTQTNNYVAIGYLTNPSLAPTVGVGYNLLVAGKIMCEELKIKIKSSPNWPDYVFASDYKLMTIDSLQSYIIQNSHLPNVPSAKEVEENGIMAGEMNGILLKKVEELTLYMIEQNKTSSTQAEQIELLKKQNELLMEQVQLLVKSK
jgi:hypothetical protein